MNAIGLADVPGNDGLKAARGQPRRSETYRDGGRQKSERGDRGIHDQVRIVEQTRAEIISARDGIAPIHGIRRSGILAEPGRTVVKLDSLHGMSICRDTGGEPQECWTGENRTIRWISQGDGGEIGGDSVSRNAVGDFRGEIALQSIGVVSRNGEEVSGAGKEIREGRLRKIANIISGVIGTGIGADVQVIAGYGCVGYGVPRECDGMGWLAETKN